MVLREGVERLAVSQNRDVVVRHAAVTLNPDEPGPVATPARTSAVHRLRVGADGKIRAHDQAAIPENFAVQPSAVPVGDASLRSGGRRRLSAEAASPRRRTWTDPASFGSQAKLRIPSGQTQLVLGYGLATTIDVPSLSPSGS